MRPTSRYLSARYRDCALPFEVVAADGTRLIGHRLGHGPEALVFCHGFLGWHLKPRLVRFQEELGRWFTVYAFDFRGHGESEGLSSFGATEHLDVDAVVSRARGDGFGRVVSLGASMGGIAVIRHAALIGGVEAVLVVSTPAQWDGHDSEAVSRMEWFAATSWGRRFLRAYGVRVASSFQRTESPADLVGRIAPIPLVIVHGRDDHFFHEDQAWLLYRRASPPKRLLLAGRFGHAEDGFSPAFAGRVARTLLEVA